MQIKAEEISQIIKDQIAGYTKDVDLKETGTVLSVGDGIARVYGVENCQAMESLFNTIFALASLLSSTTMRIPSLFDSSLKSVIPSIFLSFTSSAIFSISLALFTR